MTLACRCQGISQHEGLIGCRYVGKDVKQNSWPMFSPAFVCLFVCLCNYSKTNKYISLKILTCLGLTEGSDYVLGKIQITLEIHKIPDNSTVQFSMTCLLWRRFAP